MKRIKRLPDSELEIMQIIWRSEPPVSRVTIEEDVRSEHELATTTILTLLSRLSDKGFLRVEKKGRTNFYTPLVSERDYLASESRSILDKLYGGSLKAFAVALSDSGISKDEIEELREMLERGEL